MNTTFIIAEAGSCHEGFLDKAHRLIDLAHEAGATAVKFQYCSNPEKLTMKRGGKLSYYRWSIYQEWFPYLHAYCGDRIEFMCTAYLTEDIATVAPWVKRFKISAYESADTEFFNAHLSYRKADILVSSLASTIRPSGTSLYCVSKYPCPPYELNLHNIKDFWGLSDHTRHPLTGALAVAAGAEIVETHFRLNDTTPECPDYVVARSPEELHIYIRNIKEAEVLLG